ncbi:synaptotagmin-like protein 2 isoform X6 [Cygnus atratus]|uniref:synaptotagmin-like protein 2 isoform X6 n=1 Tax=Cygnus atratus TaxID=8868 RepID=UPI0015D5D606|nr:synaptotagmin-like protein 2 isoform X6 [Cygnus atratus]XP_035416296.1 synaptotagmin-like protein 2 isoform X6 [Cygnus atratus]XP_035416297.1 synaptotagmin-like protein 2 isoform X6 [Cygnus atratus]XP_035416299.1 synaptotagmin-like protein 2 isoform X6 [Cygnus atratus]XP_035416300.1 synaptotagmin-like protein 2 isoform X6 [Cygnus atratus]XP_035416301.1 synaptotagmin-like protein 2 isoform X6 [Cygnus atratus]XP_050564643.1 synaptotagmin-like protein 2 isoform X6 [Cygnus atratus]XP_05056464
MIDLSFLTEEEQEAIMKVLQRDAELKKAEEERVRHLPEKVKDDVQLKNMSGQWFYEAKSKRHRDKIHGADIIRASMRRKPSTVAEASQSKSNKAKNSWVSNVNKEVVVPPELHGIVEHQEEEELKSSSSSKTVTSGLDKPEGRSTKAAVSPVKQRRNPFNSTVSGDNLSSGESENRPDILPQLSKKEILSPSIESQPKTNVLSDETETPKKPSVEPTDESQNGLVKRPIPKARKLVHKITDPVPQREDIVPKPAKRTQGVNGTGIPPRGILKRSSSSSSTDSEVRVNQMLEVQSKNSIPTKTIFEGEVEKNTLTEEVEESAQISLEKLKQVRFSSSIGKRESLQSPQIHHSKETGELDLLESGEIKTSENDAVGTDSLGNKQTSTVKPLGTHSSSVHVKTHSLQEDKSASSPCDTNGSVFLVNKTFQTKIVTPKKLETPQKTSTNILSNSNKELSVDETCENKSNQSMSRESKSLKNSTDEHLLSAETKAHEVSNTNSAALQQGSEELNPVLMALKRSADRKMPSKSLEDIPSATSNKGKINIPKEELALSAEDGLKTDQDQERNENAAGISTVPPQPDKLFSNPEKLKGLSKSVPSFLQEESDDRETDTASESSYSLGRIKKSPSSLTNLSGSSGMASLSSVSGSLMSVYSGDFGNVDVKGNIQFAIDYVEQLNELHIFICQCKDLAVADVKRQRSDPYVKTYLLPEKYKLGKRKTSVKKKTFNPVYNEILRYKIEKDLLKNQSLNISVWHNDTFGRNSFLGEVELDLGTWDWNDKSNKQINWFPLKPRTSTMALELENRGEMKLALKYVPQPAGGKKTLSTGEVHIWVKECHDLPLLRGNRLNSFIKCTILPDTSRKSRQKTRTVAKTTNPVFNHTMVYDGFRPEDLKEACIELTVWDHNKLANHFLGGLRIGLGTGRSYGTTVDWMDSTSDESALWEKMMNLPNTWVEDTLPLRMLMVAKLTK